MVRALSQAGYKNLITRTRAELELRDAQAVERFFAEQRPQAVVLAAAKVGGIYANSSQPWEFLSENLAIQGNVIAAAHRHDTQRLIFLGSSCIYPRNAPQPLKEEYLLTGALEETNRAYAVAKIAGVEMVRSLRQQHGRTWLSLMPTNLYGINDNYDPEGSHVLAALLRKVHLAKASNQPSFEVWGSGKPRREFMCSDDLGDAIKFLLELDDERFTRHDLLNVGTGTDCTITELASLIAEVVGFKGEINYRADMPDGTPRKLMDSSRLNELGWKAKIPLKEGIAISYSSMPTGG